MLNASCWLRQEERISVYYFLLLWNARWTPHNSLLKNEVPPVISVASYAGQASFPILSLSATVESFVDIFKLSVGDVGIDLSGGNGRVAEHGLDGADVSSVDE